MTSSPGIEPNAAQVSAPHPSISRGGQEVAPRTKAWPPRDPSQLLSGTFEMLILQPTTLCNLDCSYCYLPDRRSRRLMSVRVAERAAASVQDQANAADVAATVDVVWHAGEPLATPVQHFRRLLEPFEQHRLAGLVQHQVQTNATLINDAWCEVLRRYDIRVGVSIDGPEPANLNRTDWRGNSSFDRTLRGIERLRSHGIPFHAICVITPETVTDGAEIVRFFAGLGCDSVGFNIEEHEGVVTDRPMIGLEEATGFWRDILRAAKGYHLSVRELRGLTAYLSGGQFVPFRRLEPIPTVSFNGDVVLLSPELAEITDPVYADFRAGNVLSTSVPQMIRGAHELRYVREFAHGLAACRATCEFWGFCRGAQAGNRYFEHGTFSATETNYCRTTKQALVLAAAQLTEERDQ